MSYRLASPIGLALVCAAILFHHAAGALAAGAGGKPATHTITIEAVAYQPASLVVRRGDTVVWVNKDPYPHTVTAAGVFDSRNIAGGASWRYVARVAGSFAYICTLHPNMKGTLTVR